MINKKIMTKKECLFDLKEIFDKNKNNIHRIESYRLFKYKGTYNYIGEDYYTNLNKNLKKEDSFAKFNDIENHEDVIIVDPNNIEKLLKECG